MPVPLSGHKCKLYRNTGSAGTPVWDSIDAVGDVSLSDFNMGLAELKARISNFALNLPTLIQTIALEFDLKFGLDMTTWSGLKDDFLAGTPRQYAVMDGAIATATQQGLVLPGLIENFPWDQGLEKVVDSAVRIVSAYYESPAGTRVDPAWLVVS